MAKEYSIRQLEKSRKLSAELVDTNPVFMPVGRIRPETFNQALERIMTASIAQGMTFQEAFDQLRPSYDYDGDFDEEYDEDDDDEFELSEYSEYENSAPEDKSVSTTPAPTPQKSAETADDGVVSASAYTAEIEP